MTPRHALDSSDARARQARAALDYLDLKERSRILDWGCGDGARALALAERGHRVLGVDVEAALVAAARARVGGRSLSIHFLALDMRRIPYEEEFHAALCMGGAFGEQLSEAEDLRCLRAVRRALKPRGRVLLDCVNREWALRALDAGSGELEGEYDLHSGRWTLAGHSRRLYSLTETRRLLREAGFTFLKVWGGAAGEPYGLAAPRMLVLAERGPDAKPLRSSGCDDLPRALRIKGRPR